MKDHITIGLVEDQLLIRTGIKNLIDTWDNMHVIYESEKGYSVPKELAEVTELPDVLLVDLKLPNHGDRIYSGAHLTLDLRAQFENVKIIILSVQDDPVTIADLIEKGAHGFLPKSCSPSELRNAILSVCHHGSYINYNTLQVLQNRLNQGKVVTQTPKAGELTGREVDVLRLICQQLTAEEIGEKLFISPKTVNGHRNNLLQKTGSRNITGLVMYAVKHGLVEID